MSLRSSQISNIESGGSKSSFNTRSNATIQNANGNNSWISSSTEENKKEEEKTEILTKIDQLDKIYSQEKNYKKAFQVPAEFCYCHWSFFYKPRGRHLLGKWFDFWLLTLIILTHIRMQALIV